MARTLTRQQLEQVWQNLQAGLKGVPADFISTDAISALSDDALQSRIDTQQAQIDSDAAMTTSRRPAVDLNATFEVLEDDDVPPPPAGSRLHAINTLKTPNVADPANMAYFHALLGAYSEGQNYTIPDLAFDDTITESERTAADEIARRLEAGENAPAIEAAFAQNAATLEEAERQAAIAEQERLAREAAAARQQANLETSVDAHLAAGGYIDADKIGTLTDNQRAVALQRFMVDHAEILQTEGTESAKLGNIAGQERAAIDVAGDLHVTDKALTILTVGRQDEQMAEEVENWLESGDPKQIMMAQATIGVQVTGAIDTATFEIGKNYIHTAYPTSLDDIDFIHNATGSLNPTLLYNAANEGKIYMPTIDELRAAGVDEATLESIQAAPLAADLLDKRAALEGKDFADFTDEDKQVWVSDTQEELIAGELLQDQTLYTRLVEARNGIAANATLDVTPPVDVAAAPVELGVIDLSAPDGDVARVIPASLRDEVAGDDATRIDELAAANNPLGLLAVDNEVIGGMSPIAGAGYNNEAIAKTANGTLVFDGPDTSLNMIVNQLRPADGTLTMEEALRSVHYLQETQHETFLKMGMGMGDVPGGYIAGRISQTLGYEPDHEFNFNNPEELKALLTGVTAYNNKGMVEGNGNIVDNFVNSTEDSVIAIRESIARVADGTPLLTSTPTMIADTDASPSRGIDLTATGTVGWDDLGVDVGDAEAAPDTRADLFNPDGSFKGSLQETVDGGVPVLSSDEFNARFSGAALGEDTSSEADNTNLETALQRMAAEKAAALNGPGGMN